MTSIALKNCRLFDGINEKVIEEALVVFNDTTELIEFAGKASDFCINAETKVIDCNGYTVMPGLINVHAHMNLVMPFLPYRVDQYSAGYCAMMVYRRAVEALQCGITSVRCVADRHFADIAVRNAINKKMFWGPNLVCCGNMLIAHNGHSNHNPHSVECSGRDEFLRASRTMLHNGADFLKICITGGFSGANEGFSDKQMTDDEVSAVVEVAHMAGKKVAVHVGGDKPIQDALRLGVDSFEHCYVMSDETADKFKDLDRWLVPTLSVTRSFDYLLSHGAPEYQVNKARAAAHVHEESIQRAIVRKIKMAVGTDLLPSDPVEGTNATIYEMEVLSKAGLPTVDVLKAATINGATLCGINNITGSIEKGKLADLILIDGKPELNVSDVRKIVFVAKSGNICWSNVPGHETQVLQATLPSKELTVGTYQKW